MRDSDNAVGSLNRTMTREDRDNVIKNFNSGGIRILVTMSSSLSITSDIHNVAIVINYDMPLTYEHYFENIVWCSDCRRKGRIINFITHRDLPRIEMIQKHFLTRMEEFIERDV